MGKRGAQHSALNVTFYAPLIVFEWDLMRKWLDTSKLLTDTSRKVVNAIKPTEENPAFVTFVRLVLYKHILFL